ncbi:MAG: glycoside hydrolase family 3 protein, partial [Lachnospiraceae bacterium]
MGLRRDAEQLMRELTLDEKIGMIHGVQLFQTAGVPRLGIPPLKMSDGPMGVRQEFPASSWKPMNYSDDYVTYLPCNSALAATWNRMLSYEMGSVLGEEARGRGKDVILAPGINIKRSPLCGRNFEYFSEDPYLTKEMAVPYIQGVQAWDVAACVKHFAVNNQETERLWVEVQINEQVLREIYLPAFYDAVTKGNAYSIMAAYNRLYGQHCCHSDFLLNQVLRKEWQYDGVVIS